MASRIQFPRNLDIIAVFCLAVLPDLLRSIVVFTKSVETSSYPFAYLHGSLIVRSLQVSIPILLIMHLRGVAWSEHGFTAVRPFRDVATATGLVAVSYVAYVCVYIVLVRLGTDFHTSTDVITSMIRDMSPTSTIAIPVMMASSLANGFAEELALRSYLVPRLLQVSGSKAVTVLVTSSLFSAYHLYQGPLGAASAFVVGLVFGTYFVARRRFWPIPCSRPRGDRRSRPSALSLSRRRGSATVDC